MDSPLQTMKKNNGETLAREDPLSKAASLVQRLDCLTQDVEAARSISKPVNSPISSKAQIGMTEAPDSPHCNDLGHHPESCVICRGKARSKSREASISPTKIKRDSREEEIQSRIRDAKILSVNPSRSPSSSPPPPPKPAPHTPRDTVVASEALSVAEKEWSRDVFESFKMASGGSRIDRQLLEKIHGGDSALALGGLPEGDVSMIGWESFLEETYRSKGEEGFRLFVLRMEHNAKKHAGSKSPSKSKSPPKRSSTAPMIASPLAPGVGGAVLGDSGPLTAQERSQAKVSFFLLDVKGEGSIEVNDLKKVSWWAFIKF